MRLFLDTSVVLAACGRASGAARAIFAGAPANGWLLLTSAYVLGEVEKNLAKFPPEARQAWSQLAAQLTVTRDVWTYDRPVVFAPAKDRPILFTAAAWARVLLTLDTGDFAGLMPMGFYHLEILKPAEFLVRERATGRLSQ